MGASLWSWPEPWMMSNMSFQLYPPQVCPLVWKGTFAHVTSNSCCIIYTLLFICRSSQCTLITLFLNKLNLKKRWEKNTKCFYVQCSPIPQLLTSYYICLILLILSLFLCVCVCVDTHVIFFSLNYFRE